MRELTYRQVHEMGIDELLAMNVNWKIVPSDTIAEDLKACYESSDNLANLLRVDMNGPAEGAKALLRVLILHGLIDEEQRLSLHKEIDAAFIS